MGSGLTFMHVLRSRLQRSAIVTTRCGIVRPDLPHLPVVPMEAGEVIQ